MNTGSCALYHVSPTIDESGTIRGRRDLSDKLATPKLISRFSKHQRVNNFMPPYYNTAEAIS